MFIAGVYRYNTSECQISLNSIVYPMAQKLLYRHKQYFLIEDNEICFVSNNQQETASDLILAYSGQILNIEGLITQLSLPSGSAYETVLKSAYKKWNSDFICHIEGEFTIALYDKINHIFFLSRDRVGMKPLYYCYDDSKFIFASEVQALLMAVKERKINFTSLHSGILLGSVYSKEHLIKGIYELRAGHNLIMSHRSQTPVIQKYWDRVFSVTKLPFAVYEKEFKRLLKEAVKKRLPSSPIKIGISSSGGIDSTLVLALVKELYSGPIESYTAIAEGDQLSEYQDARLVAKHFQIKHHEIFVSAREAIENLPKIIWHMSEFTTPYRLVSIPLQTYFVGKLAGENACSCIFTGNGVEHNFDGNGSQRILYKFYHDSNKIPALIRDRLIPFLPIKLQRLLKGKNPHLVTTKEVNTISEFYILANSWWWWTKEAFLKGFYTENFLKLLGSYRAEDILSCYLKDCTAQEYFNKLLYVDFKTWNSRRNLVTNERLFGAFGIQMQIPFLDVDLIEFSSTLPISVKHNFKDSKYFLRKIYSDQNRLPSMIWNKGKRDSILNFDFYKGEVLEIISYFVEQLKKRGIFKKDFIDRVLTSSKDYSKKSNYRFRLIGLFELELWLRIFIDRPGIEKENLTLDYLAG